MTPPEDVQDDTIVIVALSIMKLMLPWSKYPDDLQRKLAKRADELIEYLQSRYPKGG